MKNLILNNTILACKFLKLNLQANNVTNFNSIASSNNVTNFNDIVNFNNVTKFI